MDEIQETPQEEQFENQGEETQEEQVTNEEVIASEDTNDVQEVAETQADNAYYSPEEMRTLQVDGIDTSRIPPEMQPLYQAMQAPITRKSQELSEKMKGLEQGQAPLQEQQSSQTPQPSIDEMAVNVTLQNMGLAEKPEPWDDGYEGYMMELSDNRRDLKDSVNKQSQAMNELNTFKSGFTPEQFKDIDSQAETKMYQLLADPSTRQQGQLIQQAMQQGDTKTVLSFVRDVAKEVLSASPKQTQQRSTPPKVSSPSGNVSLGGQTDPSKMNSDEYRAYRMGTA